MGALARAPSTVARHIRTYARTSVRKYVRACARTYAHAHTYARACLRKCTYVLLSLPVRTYAWNRNRVRACVRTFSRVLRQSAFHAPGIACSRKRHSAHLLTRASPRKHPQLDPAFARTQPARVHTYIRTHARLWTSTCDNVGACVFLQARVCVRPRARLALHALA